MRPLPVDGRQAIAIHAADGTPIGAAPSLALATAAILRHGMRPALMHWRPARATVAEMDRNAGGSDARAALREGLWQDALAIAAALQPAQVTPAMARAAARAAQRIGSAEAAATAACLLVAAPLPPACRLACALALVRGGCAAEGLAVALADAAALLHPAARRVLGPVARAEGLPPGFAAMAAGFLRRGGSAAP